MSLPSVWSRLVSGALDYQLPDGLVDPRAGVLVGYQLVVMSRPVPGAAVRTDRT